MTHLINRLQFEMKCPDEEQAFQVRQNFTHNYQQQIMDVVDRICSKYIQEDEWIRIDKLEIDLGKFSPSSFDADFPEVFLYQFEKELVGKLSDIPLWQRQHSREHSHTELLQYFLLKGTLPWWAEESAVNIEEISLDLISNHPDSFRQFLHENRYNTVLWKRMAYQLHRMSMEKIISHFGELTSAMEQFEGWVQFITGKIVAGQFSDTNKLKDILQRIVLENAPALFENPGNNNTIKRIFSDHINKLFPDNLSGLSLALRSPDIEAFTVLSTASPEITDLSHFRSPVFDQYPVEKYYVKQAGIVLLAPFLQSFFSELGLLNGDYWKNREARYRAVHLLKFLGTGLENLPEYSLSLEKLLCGTDIEEPIPLYIALDENETKEVQLLLESIINHWKVLKNTSIIGLQETYLKRDGIITRKENGWLVQVERKSWDILLDSIPWGYSTISLPWNDYIIYTEW